MKFQTKIFTVTTLLLLATTSVNVRTHAQAKKTGRDNITLPGWGIKTNILYDATATINLGVEMRTSRRTSLEIVGNYNNWEFSNDRKWKHYLIQPEFRWWPRRTFEGNFFGLHAHWALYNIGNLPSPPFSTYMNTHRFEGSLAGAGVSYGYRWNFNNWLALEATVGIGYAYLDYKEFVCGRCGESLGAVRKHYFGPTKAGLSLIFGIGSKNNESDWSCPDYTVPALLVSPIYEPLFRAAFVTPEVEAVKARSVSGSAYIDFEVARTEILKDFRNNAVELQKIYSTIELVRNNPNVKITGISIVGHASPEHDYESNMKLSEQRAQSLRDHIGAIYGFDRKLISAWGVGEDWDGLDSLVASSKMLEKSNLLKIIRSSDDHDRREWRLKTLNKGREYRQILADYYPKLRRSDYKISYTVVPFSVEKGKEVFETRPGDLSLNEMFLISKTYPEGSFEFIELFETAVRLFPTSDVANLNAAASSLIRGDAIAAARYLDRVRKRGEEWCNNMGILSWLRGDKRKAAEYFAAGGASGAYNSRQLQKHNESITTN